MIYVYQRVSEQFFGLTEGTLRTGININREEFGVFKNFYIHNQSILIENGYMEVSLSGISPNLAKEIAEQHGLKESPNIRITDDYIDGNPEVGGVHHNDGFKRTYIS
ncbi:TPA: hypothetical protein QCY63_005817 [Bacillus cereus]|nr:hypothetical protein [Bacillus cereus]